MRHEDTPQIPTQPKRDRHNSRLYVDRRERAVSSYLAALEARGMPITEADERYCRVMLTGTPEERLELRAELVAERADGTWKARWGDRGG